MKIFVFCFLIMLVSGSGLAQNSENFDITYQRCEWEADPYATELSLSGKITYYFKVSNDNIQTVELNLADNMSVDAVKRGDMNLSYTHADNLVRIILPEKPAIGVPDSLSISYHGIPNKTGFGSFDRSYHNGVPIIWTLSEPYGAEDWFPCKNDLKDKVDSIDIFIQVPVGHKAASNGVLMSVTPVGENKNVYHWKHRHPVASYLIAFAVTDYAGYSDWYKRSETDSLEILNYVYPEYLTERKTQTPITISIMEFFEEKFGRYPFSDEKYGHAEFGWGGGMEHQTMSFMNNFGYRLIAHELVHQWFGDMITCGSWHEIWLNEGFATYGTALFQEKMFPNDWEAWKDEMITDITSETGGSVYRYEIPGTKEIFNSRFTYKKAGFVLHMLRYILGDDAFFQAVWNYAHDPKLRFGFAYTADLQKHFEDASEKDLSEFFDNWVYKEGYPVYDMTVEQLSVNEAVLTVKQTPSHPSVLCFNMPLTVKFIGEGGAGKIIVFENDRLEQKFTFDPGFVITDIVFDPDRRILCKYEIRKTTGIESRESDKPFKLFPNPAKDIINVKTNFDYSVRWKLSDSSGKTLKSGVSESGSEFVVDTSELNSGAYLITFLTDFKELSTKLMIVR